MLRSRARGPAGRSPGRLTQRRAAARQDDVGQPLPSGLAPLAGVAPEDHVEFWVIDKEHANNDLLGQLLDAALTVR